jgi:prepilin-type processing-associated H-X9-DG protein
MLVTIGIIVILAAILFPVFARARENARRASCQSNEKQIALGLMQYIQDNDGRFPLKGTGSGDTLRWPNYVYPYVKSLQIFQCPSKNRNKKADDLSSDLQSQYGIPYASGNTNTELLSSTTGYPEILIQDPTRTMMVTETRNGNDNSGLGYYTPAWTLSATANRPEDRLNFFTADIHLDGYNVAFADGHVKWVKNGTGNQWIWRCPALPNQAYTNQGTAAGQCPGA